MRNKKRGRLSLPLFSYPQLFAGIFNVSLWGRVTNRVYYLVDLGQRILACTTVCNRGSPTFLLSQYILDSFVILYI